MGLLTTCTDTNRVIHNGKTVTYSRRKIYGTWLYASGLTIVSKTEAWEYHRYCSLSYSYVGLTKAAAISCAATLVTTYTRSCSYSKWDATNATFSVADAGSQLMAEITPRQTQGDMWQIDVNVREDDSRQSLSVLSPSSFFTAEDARSYDGADA